MVSVRRIANKTESKGGKDRKPLNYKIEGGDFQSVLVKLKPGQSVRAEPGALMWVEEGIAMDTSTGGGFMAGLKRMFARERFFITSFTHRGKSPGATVAFTAPYPGKIMAVNVARQDVIAQKGAYLCSSMDVEAKVTFSKRLGAGFFGGEGFTLQRLTGNGMAFLHAGGHLFMATLKKGEKLRVETGHIVAFEEKVDYDIEMVPGVKTALFGGTGLFWSTFKGPGKVWMQTTPLSALADTIVSASAVAQQGRGRGLLALDYMGNPAAASGRSGLSRDLRR